MRERQIRFVKHEVAEGDQVEVNRPRRVAHACADAPLRILYSMHPPCEIMYLKRRLERGDLIQEAEVREFRRHVHSRVVEQAARPHEMRPRQFGQRAQG